MDRLQSMRVFQRVVDEGSFAAAARALDLSPAVVTRLVADLEEHLGARLLQRSTRRLSLTEAGDNYLARVRNILQDIDEAESLASSHTHALAGVLRLQMPPVVATHVVAPLISGFRQLHPKIRVDIEVHSIPEPSIEEYDITLLGADTIPDEHVIARRIIESEAFLVASPAYLERKGTPHYPGDLPVHECLRLKVAGSRPRSWRMWCPQAPDEPVDLPIEPVLWANHTDSLMRAALDGAGITSVAMDLAAPYLASGQLVRVLAPWITGRLSMHAALPSRKFMPQRTRVFLEYLTEQTRLKASAALEACAACA